MKFTRRRDDEEQGIDISPLIDMVFILLIFFMVSTTFVKDQSLEIDRPGAMSAAPANTKALRIFIDNSARIYLDGNPVKIWMLQSRVRELLRSASDKQILVVVDKSVPADRLIEVVDQCRLAGASDVGVATEREAG